MPRGTFTNKHHQADISVTEHDMFTARTEHVLSVY
jgi:hypothetical protein